MDQSNTQQVLPRSRPRSSQTTVSVNWDDTASNSPHPRMKFELAECIETKTITTTTTTKRSFPPMFVREPRTLTSLDSKEYPLAQKPTPPELANFTFDSDEHGTLSWPTDSEFGQESFQSLDDELNNDIKTESESAYGSSRRFPKALPRYECTNHKQNKLDTHATSPSARGLMKRPAQRSGRSHASAVSDKLRRAIAHGNQKEGVTEHSARLGGLPITPDASELIGTTASSSRPPLRLRRSNLDSFETPDSDPSQQHSEEYFNISSPSGSDSHTVFSGSNVATPPVTDADAEAFVDADESLQQSIRALHHPRPINTLVAQDASLPSPRLSPTLQAAQLLSTDRDDDDEDLSIAHDDSQTADDDYDESLALAEVTPQTLQRYGPSEMARSGLMDNQSMLDTFDAMPAEMKSFMMYQFLRRCSRKVLHVVAGVVNPALKCDVLKDLPLELTLHIISYLSVRERCRAAQVSKTWRNIIDSDETGWKELLDRDGSNLPPGELDRAIKEGWGWQDPEGPEGCERDLSLQNRLTASESELRSKPDPPPQKLRSSKRKRAVNNFGSDRFKRRASAQDNVVRAKGVEERPFEVKIHKSEGPNSAANAAALAVPDPHIGLGSLRKLHLFKSLYRRHYMIQKSWTSGKVKPSHVAFAAHPRHVITCLQFDEDKIITGSDDQLIHIYDTKTGKLRKRLEGHEGGVWALQYEGNILVSGSTDRSVRVWDIEKGLCSQVFYGHTSTVRCLQILMPTDTGRVENGAPVMMPPKPLIITGSRDSQLRVWRLPEPNSRRYIQTGPPANDADCPYFIRTLHGHTHSVRAIAAHADTLVSGSYDNTVRVWKISTGETVHTLTGHTQKVYSVVLDTARNRCISGSMDSFVKIWDLETGACTHTLEGHTLLVGLLDLRDERLVSAAADSTLRIWDPESGRCQSTLTAHTGAITCFQHDGRKVISGSDRTLKMWDIRTGECIQDLLTDLSGVWQVRFDERRCVAAVQRDSLTYVEILDFGAVRDGKNPEELGRRILLNPSEVQRLTATENDDN